MYEIIFLSILTIIILVYTEMQKRRRETFLYHDVVVSNNRKTIHYNECIMYHEEKQNCKHYSNLVYMIDDDGNIVYHKTNFNIVHRYVFDNNNNITKVLNSNLDDSGLLTATIKKNKDFFILSKEVNEMLKEHVLILLECYDTWNDAFLISDKNQGGNV